MSISINAEKFFTHPLGIVAAATGTTFLWGSAFPFIKLGYQHLAIHPDELFEQLVFAGYRFVLAGMMIILFILVLGKSIAYQRGTLLPLAKVSTFQTLFQYLLFYIGLSYSTGIQGSIIAGTTSFFQIIIAHFMYKNDAINMKKVYGLIIGFTGVILASLNRGTLSLSFGWGEVLLLAAMFSGGMGNILAKNAAAQMNILYMTGYQMLMGGVVLTLIGSWKAGFFPFVFDGRSLLILVYLSVISAAGFILWNNIMKYNKVGNVSMYLFLIPVFGVILSAAILGEEFHLIVLLALALVVSGIILVNRDYQQKETKAAHSLQA